MDVFFEYWMFFVAVGVLVMLWIFRKKPELLKVYRVMGCREIEGDEVVSAVLDVNVYEGGSFNFKEKIALYETSEGGEGVWYFTTDGEWFDDLFDCKMSNQVAGFRVRRKLEEERDRKEELAREAFLRAVNPVPVPTGPVPTGIARAVNP